MSSLDSTALVLNETERRTSRRARVPMRADKLLGAVVPAIALVVWWALSRFGVLPPNWLPGPGAVAQAVVDEAVHGALFEDIGVTVARILIGFSVGAALGTLAGAFTGYFRRGHQLLDPTLQALRSIPSMAWVPLFLLWMGIQESSKISLIALGAFFPVYLNTSAALRNVDSRLIEVGQVFRLSSVEMVRRILLPASLPQYLIGLRGGLGLAWMFVVAAEIMGASKGIGYLMEDAQMTGRSAILVASVGLFAVFGKLTDLVLESAGRYLLRHRGGQ